MANTAALSAGLVLAAVAAALSYGFVERFGMGRVRGKKPPGYWRLWLGWYTAVFASFRLLTSVVDWLWLVPFAASIFGGLAAHRRRRRSLAG